MALITLIILVIYTGLFFISLTLLLLKIFHLFFSPVHCIAPSFKLQSLSLFEKFHSTECKLNTYGALKQILCFFLSHIQGAFPHKPLILKTDEEVQGKRNTLGKNKLNTDG